MRASSVPVASTVTAETVDVWLIDTDLPASLLTSFAALLDEDERWRVAAMTGESQRRRFTAAHGVTRVIVGDRLGLPPERLRWRRGRHGKPEIVEPRTGLQVNMSHSSDLAMVAVTEQRPVGVDIQRLRHRLDPARFAARFFPDVETGLVTAATDPAVRAERLAQLWTRKEACVKAAGGRLAHGLTLPVWPGGAAEVPGTGVLVRDPAGALPGEFLVRDIPVPPGFRAAVALAGADPYRVAQHRWSGGA